MKFILVPLLTVVTVFLCNLFPNAADNSQAGMTLKLPKNIEGYVTKDIEPSSQELVWLPSDTGILKREYVPLDEKLFQRMYATLILSGSDQRSLHRPEVCLDGQGWEIVSYKFEELDVSGKPLEVKSLRLKKVITVEGQLKELNAVYVYTWVGSEITTSKSFMRALLSAYENIFFNRNTRWGYPAVMSYLPIDSDISLSQIEENCFDFYRDHGKVFLKKY